MSFSQGIIGGPPQLASFVSAQPLKKPMPHYYATSSRASLSKLISRLGVGTTMAANGVVHFNDSLINKIVSYGPESLPVLGVYLANKIKNPVTNRLAILEGLRTAEKLALAKTPGGDQLYPVVAPLNKTQDPLIQIYLAGLYRQLKLPHTFGPLVEMLIKDALLPHQYRGVLNPMTEASEEVGGAMLEMIVDKVRQAEGNNDYKQRF